VEIQFRQFFNVPFKLLTYYDYQAHWLQAPRDAHDRALAAGYEEDGRYSKFIAAFPPKDADLKVAKRKMCVAARKQK
jgi:hypothetical protein